MAHIFWIFSFGCETRDRSVWAFLTRFFLLKPLKGYFSYTLGGHCCFLVVTFVGVDWGTWLGHGKVYGAFFSRSFFLAAALIARNFDHQMIAWRFFYFLNIHIWVSGSFLISFIESTDIFNIFSRHPSN